MKNSIVYIISAIIALCVMAVYGLDLIGYGLDSTAAGILMAVIIVIILCALIISKIFSRKLDLKDKEDSSD